jgi:hypothetical protein
MGIRMAAQVTSRAEAVKYVANGRCAAGFGRRKGDLQVAYFSLPVRLWGM